MHSVSRPKVFGQHSASNEAVAEPTPSSQRRSPERGSSFSLGPNTSNSNKKRVNNASPPKSKRIRLKDPLKQFNDASGMKISTDDLKNSHSTSTLTLLFFETELQAALENRLKEAERTKQVVEQSLGNQSDAEDDGWFDEYIDDNCVGDPLELGSEDSEIYSEEGPAVDYFSAEGGCGALAEQSTLLKAGVAKRDRIKAPADTQQRFDAAIQNLSKFNNDTDPGKEITSELNKDFYICQGFIYKSNYIFKYKNKEIFLDFKSVWGKEHRANKKASPRVNAPQKKQMAFDVAIRKLSEFNNDKNPGKEIAPKLNKDYHICHNFIYKSNYIFKDEEKEIFNNFNKKFGKEYVAIKKASPRVNAPEKRQSAFNIAIRKLSKFNEDTDPEKEITLELDKSHGICHRFIYKTNYIFTDEEKIIFNDFDKSLQKKVRATKKTSPREKAPEKTQKEFNIGIQKLNEFNKIKNPIKERMDKLKKTYHSCLYFIYKTNYLFKDEEKEIFNNFNKKFGKEYVAIKKSSPRTNISKPTL